MPQRSIQSIFRERIFMQAAQHEGKGAPYIRRLIAERWGNSSDMPSQRTVGNYLKEWRGLTPEERLQWGLTKWPEVIESGAIPPEGSRAVLDLLRWSKNHEMPRPTIRFARLFALVRLADPQSAAKFITEHIQLAALLVHSELTGTEDNTRVVERALMYRPWQGDVGPDEQVAGYEANPHWDVSESHQATLHAETEQYAELKDASRLANAAIDEQQKGDTQ